MPDGSMTATVPASKILDRIPPRILGGLSAEQKSAIAEAAGDWKPNSHKINIRLSVPLLPWRWYLTVLGGPERRAPTRRTADRVQNPIRTAWNVAFIFAGATLFYGLAILGFLFSSSVLEY